MPVPVLEIGGTHVTAALVSPDGWTVSAVRRCLVDADASADSILAAWADAAASLGAVPGSTWGVAMPDPFDYDSGLARFEGVGKFGALSGVDVGARLRTLLSGEVVFVNDADAFALGEWLDGAAVSARRCVGITLGTGVGSGWVADGRVVEPGSPPGGRLHRMRFEGAPLEDVVSRRAIRRAFVASGGDAALDVREIALLARGGEPVATSVLDAAFRSLGAVAGPCIVDYDADVVVVGGSMAASWDLFEPPFTAGAPEGLPPLVVAVDSERAPLIGAAQAAGAR